MMYFTLARFETLKLDSPIVSEQNFCSEAIFFICSLTFLFLRERESERDSEQFQLELM